MIGIALITESFILQKPEPVEPWDGILNCTHPGYVCPQKPYYTQTTLDKQSEDCLNLNIYSPYKVHFKF